MGLSVNGAKALCKREDVAIRTERRRLVVQKLAALAVVASGATVCTLISASALRRLMRAKGIAPGFVSDLRAACIAGPPPVRHNTVAGTLHTVPGVPAPVPPIYSDAERPLPDFPATLPAVTLTPQQKREQYGLAVGDSPASLLGELGGYTRWAKAPYNAERSSPYTQAVQTTTIGKQLDCIRAYMGYVVHRLSVPVLEVSLDAYSRPADLAGYFAYLLARGCRAGHVRKHISIARKVNDYLQSGSPAGSYPRRLAPAMDGWLARLEAQVAAATPAPLRSELPPFSDVMEFVGYHVRHAVAAVEKQYAKGLNFVTAELVSGNASPCSSWLSSGTRLPASCLCVTSRHPPSCTHTWCARHHVPASCAGHERASDGAGVGVRLPPHPP